MAESLPLLRVRKRLLERPLRDAGSLCGDADASAIERRERDLVPLAFVSDAVADRHFAIGERKFRARRSVDAEFLFFLTDFESGYAALDHQRRDAFFSFRRIGVYVDDGRVGHATIRDPGL